MRLQLEAGAPESDTPLLECMPLTLFAALALKYAAQVCRPLIAHWPHVPGALSLSMAPTLYLVTRLMG